MARGWESKSVEDQIAESEAESQRSTRAQLSRVELEQRSKREGLLLARSHTAASLASTNDPRYRAQLERALAHLDAELAQIRQP